MKLPVCDTGKEYVFKNVYDHAKQSKKEIVIYDKKHNINFLHVKPYRYVVLRKYNRYLLTFNSWQKKASALRDGQTRK